MDLSLENHLERDPRLDGWSMHGLGAMSHTTEDWVAHFLSFEIDCELPEYLLDMFDRAKACLVYGCYRYPLLTLGSEEFFRFQESALREAVKETGASKTVQNKPYNELIKWAHKNSYLSESEQDRWNASRFLRNSASHKVSSNLVGPNEAVSTIQITVEFTEAIFRRVRSTSSAL